VPVDELSKHIRYELLDPRWKEDKKQADLNRAASAVMPGGTDVSASIRAIAAHRPDIFGGDIGAAEKQKQAERVAQSKAREKNVWDGHAASKESITLRYQQTANFDEQIAAIHKSKGVLPTEESNIGPALPAPGPAPAPPPPTAAQPSGPTVLSGGASISAGPQRQQEVTIERTTQNDFRSVGLPPGFAPSPAPAPAAAPADDAEASTVDSNEAPLPAGLPQRPQVAAPGEALPGAGPGSQRANEAAAAPALAASTSTSTTAGVTRSAPDADGDDEPSAKRARTGEAEGPTTVSEEEWLASHPRPVKISVQLPEYPAKPAWGCKGQKVELEVPLTLLVGTVRDRIAVRLSFFLSVSHSSPSSSCVTDSSSRPAGNGRRPRRQATVPVRRPHPRQHDDARDAQPRQRRDPAAADQGQEVVALAFPLRLSGCNAVLFRRRTSRAGIREKGELERVAIQGSTRRLVLVLVLRPPRTWAAGRRRSPSWAGGRTSARGGLRGGDRAQGSSELHGATVTATGGERERERTEDVLVDVAHVLVPLLAEEADAPRLELVLSDELAHRERLARGRVGRERQALRLLEEEDRVAVVGRAVLRVRRDVGEGRGEGGEGERRRRGGREGDVGAAEGRRASVCVGREVRERGSGERGERTRGGGRRWRKSG